MYLLISNAERLTSHAYSGKCKAWFGETHRPFLKPFLWFDPEYLEEKRLENSRGKAGDFLQDVIRKMREDRKWFKNLRVDFTEMPTVLVVQDWQPTKARNMVCSHRKNGEESGQRSLSKEPTTQELDRQWSTITKVIHSTLEPYLNTVQLDDETPLRQLGLDSILAADVSYRVKREFPTTDLHLAHFLEKGANLGSIKKSISHNSLQYPREKWTSLQPSENCIFGQPEEATNNRHRIEKAALLYPQESFPARSALAQ